MASHSVHPDVHEYGLADDCPRCDELAARPLELDDEMMQLAWRKMLAVEYGEEGDAWGDDAYRSGNEAKLGKYLYEFSLFIERYLNINPRRVLGEPAP